MASPTRMLPGDSSPLRKQRGAFFTPYEIAEFTAGWALAGRSDARILDPTSGEGVFLLAAAQHLRQAGVDPGQLADQLYGGTAKAAHKLLPKLATPRKAGGQAAPARSGG